jgi:hypothetical protein
MALPATVRVKLSSESAWLHCHDPRRGPRHCLSPNCWNTPPPRSARPCRIGDILKRGSLVSGASRFRWEGWDARRRRTRRRRRQSAARRTRPPLQRRSLPRRPFSPDLRMRLELPREFAARRRFLRRRSFWDACMLQAGRRQLRQLTSTANAPTSTAPRSMPGCRSKCCAPPPRYSPRRHRPPPALRPLYHPRPAHLALSHYNQKNMSRVLMVASEATPFAKTGGLADVIGALPAALNAAGNEVAVVMPRYRQIPYEETESAFDGLQTLRRPPRLERRHPHDAPQRRALLLRRTPPPVRPRRPLRPARLRLLGQPPPLRRARPRRPGRRRRRSSPPISSTSTTGRPALCPSTSRISSGTTPSSPA